ncbi:Hypothetical predicted protein [Mytilus galloprovincialis]|uniref:HMCN n=1 Tax=Mytilus galloprovincialis TaxID=29158 RepID=A0A8B6G5F5_MYTGA|nr:Hypothetical predicted protein [Mytilus galloprovincialis]
MERIVISLVLLFLICYVGDAAIMITENGTNATMNCTTNSASYQWAKLISGSYQNLQTSSKYSFSGKSLTIHNPNQNDSGFYQCLLLRGDSSVSGTESPIELVVKVNGGWSIWSIWSACTVTCEYGTQRRIRICNNPAPAGGGQSCQGSDTNSQTCNANICPPVNGGWSIWSEWGMCTVTCGDGTRIKTRSCNNPLPSGGGLNCQGLNTDSDSCSIFQCPVDGGWSFWGFWGACMATCGNGKNSRKRFCNNPTPANGGTHCQGQEYDNNSCLLPACAVDGGWSPWGSWGACTVTCGNGHQKRRRVCNNPIPANGGVRCQGEEYNNNSCAFSTCAEPEQQPVGSIPIAVGTVSGVLVIIIVIIIIVIYAKRRWYNSEQERNYEKTDITRGKSHIYGETHANHTYQNDLQAAEIEVTAAENTYIDEASLVKKCVVSDLTQRFRNKELFGRSLRAEFKLLQNQASNTKPCNNEYEFVDTGIRKDVNQLNINNSTLKMLYHNNVSVLLEMPQKNLAEQFWTIVEDHCIENVILLVKENEKVEKFYPKLDDIFRMKSLEIYLDSAERTNTNIMLLAFNLQNKTTQKKRNVKMFKTNVCKSLSVEAMCCILGKASEVTDATVLIINSKKTDLSVCGVLAVCLNVIYAIKNGSTFSLLENAMVANKNDRGFFKNFDDYELCYKVIENYLETVNTYDFIE